MLFQMYSCNGTVVQCSDNCTVPVQVRWTALDAGPRNGFSGFQAVSRNILRLLVPTVFIGSNPKIAGRSAAATTESPCNDEQRKNVNKKCVSAKSGEYKAQSKTIVEPSV